MTGFRARSFLRLRYEIFSFALVATVPVAIAFVFPFEAIGFRAAAHDPAPSVACAFVSLGAEEERAALAAARTAWQVDATGVRGLRADLSSGDLPPVPTQPVVSVRPPRERESADAEYAPNALPPSVAAPPPAGIAADAEGLAPSPAFSKNDLLKLD